MMGVTDELVADLPYNASINIPPDLDASSGTVVKLADGTTATGTFNQHPFILANIGQFGSFWHERRGSAVVFFALVGFDAVSHPRRGSRTPSYRPSSGDCTVLTGRSPDPAPERRLSHRRTRTYAPLPTIGSS